MELLFLLLPVAAASGWWLARRDGGAKREEPHAAAPAFFRGLNYLLDEQPDKAIDVFLKLAEVDTETAETHLALGSLFRRRGEVDRAIRIHQNLIARDTLSREQRGFALFELGQDYMRAGLLDRAELLFQEVAELGMHRERALHGLLDIYQQERDWVKCLEVAERLKPLTERPMGAEIAQYHCELAEEARREGDATKARRHLSRAQDTDQSCVRATILEGQMALEAGDNQAAVDLFLRVAEQGAPFVPEVLPDFVQALHALGRDEVPVLESLAAKRPSPQLILTLADTILRERGAEAAMETLTHYLASNVDLVALERLLALQAEQGSEDGGNAERDRVVHQVVRYLLVHQPAYQCDHCGFSARALHWQCPSCKRWGSVQPVQPERIPGDEVLHERRIA
jgi:lipopolysaccharide biosynthesis regulator YciM